MQVETYAPQTTPEQTTHVVQPGTACTCSADNTGPGNRAKLIDLYMKLIYLEEGGCPVMGKLQQSSVCLSYELCSSVPYWYQVYLYLYLYLYWVPIFSLC